MNELLAIIENLVPLIAFILVEVIIHKKEMPEDCRRRLIIECILFCMISIPLSYAANTLLAFIK